MCESCSSQSLDRREFLASAGALAAYGLVSKAVANQNEAALKPPLSVRAKEPARVVAAFLYPPADVVNAGKNEDVWNKYSWFTWPGNQFEPEQQERKFTAQIKAMAEVLGITVEFQPTPIYQQVAVNAFIEQTKAAKPDAVLIVNFWNTFAKWSHQMATESATPTAIVYQPVGSNHQLPLKDLRSAEGLYFIHAIENFDEIERGLRAVRAKKMLSQSRLLRISGRVKEPTRTHETQLETEIIEVPAGEFNAMFDSIATNDDLVREAEQVKRLASSVTDVTDNYIVDALRAHHAVGQMLQRYGADAITIECLQLKHRKPCISFAINNGSLVPCGCENDLNATLTMMLGRWLLDRGGFQHNPDFDTSENRYFGAHCTCLWKLHGPQAASQPYLIRPFFHQLPKTAALDVQWTPGEPALLAKYVSGKSMIHCWTGKIVESPTSPPVGGCATRVLVALDDVDDVCKIYPGPHPILFCGDRNEARRFKAFAKMYRLPLRGNA